MSHGYEVQLTPLQILTFYNAVANNGRMMKPRLVKEVRYHGDIVTSYPIKVINPSIASKSTIASAKVLLEGVVKNGTAKNLHTNTYAIAGKTGTAQIANEKYGYKSGGKVSYQASFVGYFPAENPVYSCIVVVNAPSNSVYYGNQVAGPVFKEIADKVYATGFFKEPELLEASENTPPTVLKGYSIDSRNVLAKLGYVLPIPDSEWVTALRRNDTIILREHKMIENLVPDVTGMGLRDALYILENAGISVSTSGRGKVIQQSLRPGTRVIPGTRVTLELKM
jgi:cell division protein FtsI (penicillin-binding protein 3)